MKTTATIAAVWAALALGGSGSAMAQDLDGDAIRALAARGTWHAEFAEYGFWDWREDGTVCLWLGAPTGECADTGTWSVDGNVLCYELTWWGASVGERDACVTVRALDDKRFETVFHGGAMESTMFAFGIVD